MNCELDRYLAVARIAREHGIKGEVRASSLTDDVKRLKKLKKCYFEQNGIYTEISVVSVRIASDNEVIILFDGITDRNAAAKLRGRNIYVDRENAAKLPEGRYFICDLEKCAVVSRGEIIASVDEVIQLCANDVFECTARDGRKLMIPFIKKAVSRIDIEERKIYLTDNAIDEVALYDEN